MSKKKILKSIIFLVILIAIQIYFLATYDHFKAEGGLKIAMKIDPQNVTKKYARASLDFDYVMKDAIRSHNQNGGDFLKALAKSNENRLQRPLIRLFNYKEISELNMNSTDDEVITFLRSQLEANLETAASLYTERIAGVTDKPTRTTFNSEALSMTIAITGQNDSLALKHLSLPKADVGFYECLTRNQLLIFWNAACLLTATDTITDGQVKLTVFNGQPADIPQTLANSVGWNERGFGMVQDRDKNFVEKWIKSPEFDSLVPKDVEFRWSYRMTNDGEDDYWNLYVIKIPKNGHPLISNGDIQSAQYNAQGAYGGPVLDIRMTQEGTDKWAEMTANNVNRLIAMCVNDVVMSAPNVINPIMDGNTQISGGGSNDNLKDVELILKSKPLEIIPLYDGQKLVKANSPLISALIQQVLLALAIVLVIFFAIQFLRIPRSA